MRDLGWLAYRNMLKPYDTYPSSSQRSYPKEDKVIDYYAVDQQLLVRISNFLKELENAADIPMHHQADIMQFRCEVLDDWTD
jgi:hypothetical protein